MLARRRILRLDSCRIDLLTRRVERQGRAALRLSATEAQLLAFLAERPEQAASRAELLAEVWGYHPDVVSRAPDVTVHRLRAKLEPEPGTPRHILTVPGRGWALHGLLRTEGAAEHAPLIGRDPQIAQLRHQLDEGTVVTLVGPPGVGKSALAAAALARHGSPSVRVDLSSVTDEATLLASTASALGIPLRGAQVPADHLRRVVQARGETLWFDAAEHVTAPLFRLLEGWQRAAVVTSRVDVGTSTMRVSPLSPPDDERLFRAELPDGLTLDDDVLDDLLAGLDGLPLAIRLAAARVARSGLASLSADDGLAYERVRKPETGEALGRAIARSWALLPERTRQRAATLAWLAEPFGLGTAEALVPGEPWVGDDLDALTQASLLERELVRGQARYRWLDSIRYFAKRQASPDVDALAHWLCNSPPPLPATLLGILERVERDRPGRATMAVLSVDDALADLLPASERRALLARVRDGGTLEVLRRLSLLSWELGDAHAWQMLTHAIERHPDAPAPVRQRATIDAIRIGRESGTSEGDARARLTALARDAETLTIKIEALVELSEHAAHAGDGAEARLAVRRALAADRDGEHRVALLCALGNVALRAGTPDEGLDAIDEALRMCDAGPLGQRAWRTLGGLRLHAGDTDGAAAAWERALELARDLGMWRDIAKILGNLAIAYADGGDTRLARRHAEEALALAIESGSLQTATMNRINLAKLALLEAQAAPALPLLETAIADSRGRGWLPLVALGEQLRAVALQMGGHDVGDALAQLATAAAERREADTAKTLLAHLAIEDADRADRLHRDLDLQPAQLVGTEAALLEHARRAH